MRNIFAYMMSQKFGTVTKPHPDLSPAVRGFPKLTDVSAGTETECEAIAAVCPTDAIAVEKRDGQPKLALDLGACIGCGLCMEVCKTGAIVPDRTSTQSRRSREALIQRQGIVIDDIPPQPTIFKRAVAARVVSTGCSACDMEIGASGNAVFDLERFGVHIVASPRFADVLIVTGPVGKGMQEPLRRAYQAMAEPRAVIALGTCAISGGVHKHGYADANGASPIIPVDVFIPGCPPHPWQIIYGIQKARGLA